MSETKDGIFYDLYDFSKSVYIFSHMKTNLVDEKVQIGEKAAIILLLVISSVIFFFVLIKTFIILIYFICSQAMTAFVRFIIMVFKTKFNINFKSSCKNSCMFFGKVCKKIYTFNFYIFYSKYISSFMIISFWICLFSNFIFNLVNNKYLENPEKDFEFLVFYFLSFEFNLLIEVICSTFYAHRNMIDSSLLAFGYYFVINSIMLIIFFIARRKEYLDGAYLLEEPQRILNIIVFFILFILKVNCLYKIIKFNKRSKYITNIYLNFY
jgi:hypothetical protein